MVCLRDIMAGSSKALAAALQESQNELSIALLVGVVLVTLLCYGATGTTHQQPAAATGATRCRCNAPKRTTPPREKTRHSEKHQETLSQRNNQRRRRVVDAVSVENVSSENRPPDNFDDDNRESDESSESRHRDDVSISTTPKPEQSDPFESNVAVKSKTAKTDGLFMNGGRLENSRLQLDYVRKLKYF